MAPTDSEGPTGPYRLLTVNNAPARAKVLIGRVVNDLQDRYIIEHVGNCTSKDELEPMLTELRPDILCCASMWTPAESSEMQEKARSILPGIKTHAIPQGLQVNQGPDAIVAHLKEQFPILLG
ncbi:hypothetical protein QBC33DRAFT_542812 [Phialemonium atrogriseum]|uniref:Uncharacterized protein n=1 Tax=Phialemonium atrogriseum TaxID=1093897 RepID=A0AAJ0BWR7_9PEZI|nr:uncharacterized protein QBC33DRAFT_542812 [Phialemonium atrogriseum]KAK1765890.1 hypothetical protein QBC33DRAFT_542812 [Phialemonium atrogriseum]